MELFYNIPSFVFYMRFRNTNIEINIYKRTSNLSLNKKSFWGD